MKGHVSCPFFITRGREVASRRAHNPETAGSNPAPAMKKQKGQHNVLSFLLVCKSRGQDENLVRLPELPQGQAPWDCQSSRKTKRREIARAPARPSAVGLPELPQDQAPKARRSSGERGIQRRKAPWDCQSSRKAKRRRRVGRAVSEASRGAKRRGNPSPAGYFFCAYPLLCYGRTIRFGPLGVAPGHIGKGYLFQRSVAWRKCIESSTIRSAR